MNSFMKYLKGVSPSMYSQLSKYTPGSSAFDKQWKYLASKNPTAFNQVQHSFIKKSHYDPAVGHVQRNIGLNINSRSRALQDVTWSISVQHGVGGAARLFKNAGIKASMTDKEIITRLYKERMNTSKYFSRSSASIQAGVRSRFQREMQDALALLARFPQQQTYKNGVVPGRASVN